MTPSQIIALDAKVWQANWESRFSKLREAGLNLGMSEADATFYAGDAMRREARHDHKYEPGAYGVCRRCGEERH